MKSIDLEIIRDFYENEKSVWPQDSAWYSYLKSEVEKYVRKKCEPSNNACILNAGSGGNDYGLTFSNMYHVDIAENKIAHLKNATVASIENLPFSDEMFDYVICVGSVINYCDAIAAIAEMSRVLKKHGVLILEFENSFSFAYYGREEYGKSAEIINLKYMEKAHHLWIYSFDYIKKILIEFSFIICNSSAFHILSGLHFKKSNDENTAASLSKFDFILRHIPYFKKHASNIILLCKKL